METVEHVITNWKSIVFLVFTVTALLFLLVFTVVLWINTPLWMYHDIFKMILRLPTLPFVLVVDFYHSIRPCFFAHWRAHRKRWWTGFPPNVMHRGCFFDEWDSVYNKQVRLYCYTHRIVMPIAPGVYFYDSSVGEQLTAAHYNIPVTKGNEFLSNVETDCDTVFLTARCIPARPGEAVKVTSDKICLDKDGCVIFYRMLIFRIEKRIEPIYRVFILVEIDLPNLYMCFCRPDFKLIYTTDCERIRYDPSVWRVFQTWSITNSKQQLYWRRS